LVSRLTITPRAERGFRVHGIVRPSPVSTRNTEWSLNRLFRQSIRDPQAQTRRPERPGCLSHVPLTRYHRIQYLYLLSSFALNVNPSMIDIFPEQLVTDLIVEHRQRYFWPFLQGFPLRSANLTIGSPACWVRTPYGCPDNPVTPLNRRGSHHSFKFYLPVSGDQL